MLARTLHNGIQCTLWHNCLGHPGYWITQYLHKCVNSAHKLNIKNHFHKCSACIISKMTKCKKNFYTNSSLAQKPNERFIVYCGFVGGKFAEKNKMTIYLQAKRDTTVIFSSKANTVNTYGPFSFLPNIQQLTVQKHSWISM